MYREPSKAHIWIIKGALPIYKYKVIVNSHAGPSIRALSVWFKAPEKYLYTYALSNSSNLAAIDWPSDFREL